MRLRGVDAARGVALLGMMCVHVAGEGTATERALHLVFDGRASALFAVLAGVGIALANGRETPPEGEALALGRRRIAVRAAFVAVIGLTLGGVETPAAIILCYYGVLFLLALPVLGWGWRRLAVAAAVAALVTPQLSQFLRWGFAPPRLSQNLAWESLADPGPVLSTVLLTGYYPVLTWTTYLLAGMAVGRLALTRSDVVARVAVAGAALALAGALAGTALVAATGVPERDFHGTTPADDWAFLGVWSPHSGATPDLVHTTGTALLVVGLLLALVRVLGPAREGLLRPLWAAGAMTLTLYALHAGTLGLVRDAFPDAQVQVLLVEVLIVLVGATIWNAPKRPGPLEMATSELVDTVTGVDARR